MISDAFCNLQVKKKRNVIVNRRCTVRNFKVLAQNEWQQPAFSALFDTGCSIQAGLVISKQCANMFKFKIEKAPRDPNVSYTCKLADGSPLAIYGFVHVIQILVSGQILTFFDVPVFEKLGYEAIFGCAAFFDQNLSIVPTRNGVQLTLTSKGRPLGFKKGGKPSKGASWNRQLKVFHRCRHFGQH